MADEYNDAKLLLIVASDQVIIREAVIRLLAETGQYSIRGDGLCDALAESAADVVLCLLTAGVDIESAIRSQKLAHPDAAIFCLFLYNDDGSVIAALQAGAQGVMSDSLDALLNRDELVRGIAQVAAGQFYLPSRLAIRLARLHVNQKAEPAMLMRDECLTRREQEVLTLLAHGNTNRDIARLLSVSEHTVRSHLRAIMQKLQVSSRAQAVAAAWKGNLVKSGTGK